MAAAAPSHPNIWVAPVTVAEGPEDAPEIAWLDAAPDAWDMPPLAHLHDGPDDPNAVIRAAMTQTHLHLHVVVVDAHHVNTRSADAIWNGDAIQVSVDPRGDAKTLQRQAPQTLQPGSLAATFALTQHGTRGWAHTRSAPDIAGPLTTPLRIERDAGRQTTTYDIALPWTLLHTTPGESTTLGLQIEINDQDASGTLHRAGFGDCPAGTFDARRFKTLRLGTPPQTVLLSAPQRLNVWRAVDAACVMVVTNERGTVRADLEFTDTQRSLTWESPGKNLRRWNVCVAPRRLLETPVSWSVGVRAQASGAQTRGTYVVQSPSIAATRDLADIGALAASATEGLSRRHLEATHAILQGVWSAALTTVDDGEAAALDAATAIARSRSLLPPRADILEHSLRSGERPLLAAFVSREDLSLQPYTLTLPRVMDAERAQPAMVFLHGRGAPSLGQYVADAQAKHTAPWEHAYVLSPWGRGNVAYRGFAETDIRDALVHADSLFHFDRERIWLGGFSMGGTGAWRLALHQPDLWAALAIFAGTPEGVPMGAGFGANIAGLPVYLHQGLADGTVGVDGIRAMQDELEKNGGKPETVLETGGGHAMTDQRLRTLQAWAAPFSRTPPAVIRYTSDRPGQTVYGITLRHDAKLATYPRVTAHVEGRQIRLDTVGTTGLDLDLTEAVWHCTDVCRVMWNGTQVYEGPAKALRLGPRAS